MDRNEALSLLKEHVTTESLLGHCIATAAVMKGLAKELGEDENLYELIGILHDIDFQEINEDMEKHGEVGYEILKEVTPKNNKANSINYVSEKYYGKKR